MYYPFLRAKQFELKALKDFFQECPDESRIVPILEPVNSNTSALLSALNYFVERRKHFAVIMNPKLGAFEHSTVDFTFAADNLDIISSDFFIPAYLVQNNADEVISMLGGENGNNVMLIFPKGTDTDKSSIRTLVNHQRVTTIVCSFSQSLRSTKSDLLALGKNIVTFEDNFKEQKRNADYLNMEDEIFSQTFRYYSEDHFQGFSDYTALPSSYSGEGMLPYALAIHLTYPLNNNRINIHHFVSDSNRDQTNIQGKFFEAARKLVAFYGQNIYRTDSVDELISRENDKEKGFPGLGYLKKLSVKNHLELIHYLLD